MSSMLRISEGAAIAIHTAGILAAAGKDNRICAKTMAGLLDVSEAHLAKILQRLARAGIVASTRGPAGGFILNADPHDITLLEVYEAIEGPLAADTCMLGRASCPGGRCIFGDLVQKVNDLTRHYLSNTRASDLAGVFTPLQELKQH